MDNQGSESNDRIIDEPIDNLVKQQRKMGMLRSVIPQFYGFRSLFQSPMKRVLFLLMMATWCSVAINIAVFLCLLFFTWLYKRKLSKRVDEEPIAYAVSVLSSSVRLGVAFLLSQTFLSVLFLIMSNSLYMPKIYSQFALGGIFCVLLFYIWAFFINTHRLSNSDAPLSSVTELLLMPFRLLRSAYDGLFNLRVLSFKNNNSTEGDK